MESSQVIGRHGRRQITRRKRVIGEWASHGSFLMERNFQLIRSSGDMAHSGAAGCVL